MPNDEFALIENLSRHLSPPGSRVLLGIGDDAAIVRTPDHPLLLCSDAMVEGVHFDLAYSTAQDIGHKALAACLSDIAAMNGTPLHALVSLAIPKDRSVEFIDGFYEGAGALARQVGLDIVGGDLSSSPGPIFVDIACVGEASHPLRRSGAKPGDWIAVSGHPGASAAGLHVLRHPQLRDATSEAVVRAHLRPTPRFDLLQAFRAHPKLATALIDVSDGLSSELNHLAKNSGVSIEIVEAQLPLHPAAVAIARQTKRSALEWALSGGEDYELLAAFDADELARLGAPPAGFHLIGRVTGRLPAGPTDGASEPDALATPWKLPVSLLTRKNERRHLVATGFNHFATKDS